MTEPGQTAIERREQETKPWKLVLDEILKRVPITKDEASRQRWIITFTELVDKTAGRLWQKIPDLKKGQPITQEIIKQNSEIIDDYIQDMVEIGQINYVLREKTDLEELTGLLNKNALAAHFVREREKLERETTGEKKAMALCSVDVDYFKRINDEYGHHVGDMALKAIAKKLNARIRATDTAARTGGDELVFLLTDVPKDQLHEIVLKKIETLTALRIAEKINDEGKKEYEIVDTDNDNEKISRLIKEGYEFKQNLSVSVAVKTMPYGEKDDINLEDALREIDGGTYMVKRKGRNGVIFVDKDGKSGKIYKAEKETGLYAGAEAEDTKILAESDRKITPDEIVKNIEENLGRTLNCVYIKHGGKLTGDIKASINNLADKIYQECCDSSVCDFSI